MQFFSIQFHYCNKDNLLIINTQITGQNVIHISRLQCRKITGYYKHFYNGKIQIVKNNT